MGHPVFIQSAGWLIWRRIFFSVGVRTFCRDMYALLFCLQFSSWFYTLRCLNVTHMRGRIVFVFVLFTTVCVVLGHSRHAFRWKNSKFRTASVYSWRNDSAFFSRKLDVLQCVYCSVTEVNRSTDPFEASLYSLIIGPTHVAIWIIVECSSQKSSRNKLLLVLRLDVVWCPCTVGL
jgi:hypothetical protein